MPRIRRLIVAKIYRLSRAGGTPATGYERPAVKEEALAKENAVPPLARGGCTTVKRSLLPAGPDHSEDAAGTIGKQLALGYGAQRVHSCTVSIRSALPDLGPSVSPVHAINPRPLPVRSGQFSVCSNPVRSIPAASISASRFPADPRPGRLCHSFTLILCALAMSRTCAVRLMPLGSCLCRPALTKASRLSAISVVCLSLRLLMPGLLCALPGTLRTAILPPGTVSASLSLSVPSLCRPEGFQNNGIISEI